MDSTAWVLVTGGAKRIGAFINQEFAKSGKKIVLHYNQSEKAALALKVQLETFNIRVVLWQANLDEPATLEQRFEVLLTQVPHIELLINKIYYRFQLCKTDNWNNLFLIILKR